MNWAVAIGAVITAGALLWNAWAVPTLSRRVKHHADLLDVLPDQLKEPLLSVLREELIEYSARERGRLHRSWRRLNWRRVAFIVACLVVSASSSFVWLTNPNSDLMEGWIPIVVPLILVTSALREGGLFKPLAASEDPSE